MIETIVKELEALKAKVDEAIQHAKAGVTILNEDQQEKLKNLVIAIERESQKVTDKVHEIMTPVEAEAEKLIDGAELGFETVKVKVEGFVGEIFGGFPEAIASEPAAAEPSAADLDAVAADEKAAEETK